MWRWEATRTALAACGDRGGVALRRCPASGLLGDRGNDAAHTPSLPARVLGESCGRVGERRGGLLCAWGANEDNKLPGAPMEGWGPGVLVPLPDKGLGSPRKSSSFSPFLLWKFPLSPLLTHRS